ncbi:hypothetical protein RIN58_14440 [Siccibacter colletis]|uniref:hypothetical protein n=1 Tax=Siccibacter colletis TaxID=1505757 RepID=UPI0028BF1C0E|nr:hypothetical protein [Siccibacter colletis]WNN47587.1 hypothetical protein RIN58_14440 [Siccibacter colletis]
MEIILMRHGKPAFNDAATLSAGDMAEWIEQYDLAGIASNIPPDAGGELARQPQKSPHYAGLIYSKVMRAPHLKLALSACSESRS